MVEFPQLPNVINNKIEIQCTKEVEISKDGQKHIIQINYLLDITFDEESKEVNIDCVEETTDNLC